MTIIEQIEQEQMRSDVPAFGAGDTVRVQVRVVEGDKERLQAYEGVVIAKRNRGLHSAFTVRKMSNGEGVERVFQTHSHSSLLSKLPVVVRFVVLSSTICVSLLVKQLVLLKSLLQSLISNILSDRYQKVGIWP